MRLGVGIENRNLNDLYQNPALKKEVEQVERGWHEKSIIDLQGFLLKTNPWKLMNERECFIARNQGGPIEGILIATPVGQTQTWYLEDMWMTEKTTRGTGELLTLEAMRILHEKGAKKVSLGLIPLNSINAEFNMGYHISSKPTLFLNFTVTIVNFLKNFYNADGLTLFRKRFNVVEWKPSYLSIKPQKRLFFSSASLQWLQVLVAMVIAHKPKFLFTKTKSEPGTLSEPVTEEEAAPELKAS